MNAFMRKGDFWSGIALAALGAYIVGQARQWVYMGEEGPGPGFFPIWYGGAMVVLSLLLVAGAVLKTGGEGKRVRWSEVGRAMTCWLAFAVSIGLLKIVGFVVAFALLTWFIVSVMYRQSQRKAWSLAIGGALLFHVLFSMVLEIQLPEGMLIPGLLVH
jgi:putative tricarboxylic transport membrane protein